MCESCILYNQAMLLLILVYNSVITAYNNFEMHYTRLSAIQYSLLIKEILLLELYHSQSVYSWPSEIF